VSVGGASGSTASSTAPDTCRNISANSLAACCASLSSAAAPTLACSGRAPLAPARPTKPKQLHRLSEDALKGEPLARETALPKTDVVDALTGPRTILRLLGSPAPSLQSTARAGVGRGA
jgi:hypothetical protein